MKFDTARAATTFEALGAPCFSDADAESRVAEYVMNELSAADWTVERREVSGSPWPQRLAPWIGWLGFGGVLTAIVAVLTQAASFWLTVGILPLIVASGIWFCAAGLFLVRLGSRRSPMESAPLLIGSLPTATRATARVVFQAVLGGLNTDYRQLPYNNRFIIIPLVVAFSLFSVLVALARTYAPTHVRLYTAMTWALLALAWAAIFWILLRDRSRARRDVRSYQADARGLALLLEMARNWRRLGPRRIDALFVAAGGQRQDFAGSREVIRLLETEWRLKPTLLVLFIAPGAGDRLALCTRANAASQARHLAEHAAASLWLPFRRLGFWDLAPFWPLKTCQPVVAITGCNPQKCSASAFNQNALNQSAQLATEIALRWAKKQRGELSTDVNGQSASKAAEINETR